MVRFGFARRPYRYAPALVLRAGAREALGQYPQARRDCTKVLKRLGANTPQAAREKAEAMNEKCDVGMAMLEVAGCDDPNMERVYEVGRCDDSPCHIK